MDQENKTSPREMETLERALRETGKGGVIFVVDEIPAFATKRQLASLKGRMTRLEKCVRELPELPELPDISEAFNEVVDNLEAEIIELRMVLANLAIAAAETRKIADKCAELLGVRA